MLTFAVMFKSNLPGSQNVQVNCKVLHFKLKTLAIKFLMYESIPVLRDVLRTQCGDAQAGELQSASSTISQHNLNAQA